MCECPDLISRGKQDWVSLIVRAHRNIYFYSVLYATIMSKNVSRYNAAVRSLRLFSRIPFDQGAGYASSANW